MSQKFDFVRPKEDKFKSIWQVTEVESDGGVWIIRVGYNPKVRYYQEIPIVDNEFQTEPYSKKEMFCPVGTFIKLVITEEETND